MIEKTEKITPVRVKNFMTGIGGQASHAGQEKQIFIKMIIILLC